KSERKTRENLCESVSQLNPLTKVYGSQNLTFNQGQFVGCRCQAAGPGPFHAGFWVTLAPRTPSFA
ncbi:MAG: hypothetical protein ACE5H9_02820, partial [Anaerolineae bacterium]